jgi:hypothetical protein
VAGKPNDKLTDEIRTFVVQSLAMFDPPSVVVQAVRKEYGLTITPQSVEGYNPTKRAGARLSKRWTSLFEETRKAFLEDTAEIAISHRTVRLRGLQRLYEKAENQGNSLEARACLKQAAEEQGNAYTNRRELTGADGKDLPAAGAVTIFSLPDNGRG